MEYTKLGNSELEVSRICMGCMGFGTPGAGQHSWTLGEAESAEIIRHGLELGINFFDTAIAYQGGSSERFLGNAVRSLAKRDDVVIATKFLPRTDAEVENGVSGAEHIENMLNRSLQNLGLDYVDLYIYHMWDYRTPMSEIMEGLDRVVKAGKARYIGISNCYAYQLAKANAFAEKNGLTQFVSVQCAGGRETVQASGGDLQAARGGQLRARQIRRHRAAGRCDYRAGCGAGRPPRGIYDRNLAGVAAHQGDQPGRGRDEV